MFSRSFQWTIQIPNRLVPNRCIQGGSGWEDSGLALQNHIECGVMMLAWSPSYAPVRDTWVVNNRTHVKHELSKNMWMVKALNVMLGWKMNYEHHRTLATFSNFVVCHLGFLVLVHWYGIPTWFLETIPWHTNESFFAYQHRTGKLAVPIEPSNHSQQLPEPRKYVTIHVLIFFTDSLYFDSHTSHPRAFTQQFGQFIAELFEERRTVFSLPV